MRNLFVNKISSLSVSSRLIFSKKKKFSSLTFVNLHLFVTLRPFFLLFRGKFFISLSILFFIWSTFFGFFFFFNFYSHFYLDFQCSPNFLPEIITSSLSFNNLILLWSAIFFSERDIFSYNSPFISIVYFTEFFFYENIIYRINHFYWSIFLSIQDCFISWFWLAPEITHFSDLIITQITIWNFPLLIFWKGMFSVGLLLFELKFFFGTTFRGTPIFCKNKPHLTISEDFFLN